MIASKLKHLAILAAAVVFAGSAQSSVAGGDFYTVQSSAGTPTVALGGTVVPYKEVTLSAQLPGRVKFLAGREGDAFDKDALLVSIDETELLAKRRAAYAQYVAAEAQLRNASVQRDREWWSPSHKRAPGGMGIPNLFDQMFTRPAEDLMGGRDRGAERQADIYAAYTRVEKARSAMLGASSEIQAIDARLRDGKSVAPFAGVITHKYVEVGDTVQPGQPLLKYADVTWLQVEIDVPARLVKTAGTALKEMAVLEDAATFDDHRKPTKVRVAHVFPMADAKRHTIKVKFDIPQGVSAPGMYARVQIPDPTAKGQAGLLKIPRTAIRYRGSLPMVYVAGERNEPIVRLIREGQPLDATYVSVISGLSPGDRIYSNPGPDVLARHQPK